MIRRPIPCGVLFGVVLALLPGCRAFLEYADDLTDPRSGRSLLVRAPANLGGAVGFIAGLPVDVAAAPVTYGYYLYENDRTGGLADPLSILLFPSFVLWKAGVLVATPFDLIEFAGYRAWVPGDTLNETERERIERRWDDEALPVYPVDPICPGADRSTSSRL